MNSKKPQIKPSVSVTPANIPVSNLTSNQNQKPFTITVTSVPGKTSNYSTTFTIARLLSLILLLL